MECPRCGNLVQTLPVQGVFTCDAQIIDNTPISAAVGGSDPNTTSTLGNSTLFQTCGHTFRFADLVARKEHLEAADNQHGSYEYQRQSELREIEQDAHDALVRQNEEQFGPADPLKAKVRKRDERAGRLCKAKFSYQPPLALLFFGLAVAAGLLWWTDDQGSVPSWVPATVTNFPPIAFAVAAAVALAIAVALFWRHLALARKARWGFPATLATLAAGALGYLWVGKETDLTSVPDFIPTRVTDVESELLLGAIAFLAALPVSWLISRARFWQAKAARKRWIKKRPAMLQQIGCGDQACSECMQGLQYLPRWATGD